MLVNRYKLTSIISGKVIIGTRRELEKWDLCQTMLIRLHTLGICTHRSGAVSGWIR